MSKLGDKLRAARESWETVGEYQFQIRRPTGLQLAQWSALTKVDLLAKLVVGWRRGDGSPLQEIDILQSGDPHPVPFDADVLVEWVGDHADMFVALVERIDGVLLRIAKADEDAAKNSTGS